jgi:Zn-dependent protease
MAGLLLGPVFGLRVRVHLSWVFIVALIVLFVADSAAPTAPGGSAEIPFGTLVRWLIGVAVAALFFVSVLIHELAHAFVARRFGLPVEEITLLVFGGPTQAGDEEAPHPRAEAMIAGSGPLLSLAVGGGLLAVWAVTLGASAEGLLVLGAICWWTGMANVLLGGLNLVPGFPMDGGRLLRAAFWAATKDFVKGTQAASAAGRLSGLTLVALGIWWAVSSDLIIGAWLAITGLFLRQAATMSFRRVEVGQLVEGVEVAEVMDQNVAVVGPNLTLDTLLDQHTRGDGAGMYPVTVDGSLVGTLDVRRAHRVPRNRWPTTRVSDVMTSGDAIDTLTERSAVIDALLRFENSRAVAIPVVDASDPRRLLGILTRDRLIEALRRRAAVRAGASSK